ncbi:MAG: Mur ligase family protein, partial [Spirochaetota bacterium]
MAQERELPGWHSCREMGEILAAEGFAPQYYRGAEFTAPLRGAVVDSREAGPGLLFAARRGEARDGHDFLVPAYKNGCRHFLVSQDYPCQNYANLCAEATFMAVKGSPEAALFAWARRYRRNLKSVYVLAVSGSYGKTSTKELLGKILAQRYLCYVTPGNRNAPVGCALSILAIPPETEIAVLELGIDHPGEMDLLCSLAQPNAALLTGIGSAHLGRFRSQEHLAYEKARIYAHLQSPSAARNKQALAFVPEDDRFLPILRSQVGHLPDSPFAGRGTKGGLKEILYSAERAKRQGYLVEDRGLEGLHF